MVLERCERRRLLELPLAGELNERHVIIWLRIVPFGRGCGIEADEGSPEEVLYKVQLCVLDAVVMRNNDSPSPVFPHEASQPLLTSSDKSSGVEAARRLLTPSWVLGLIL